jgi:hypothetical protein
VFEEEQEEEKSSPPDCRCIGGFIADASRQTEYQLLRMCSPKENVFS